MGWNNIPNNINWQFDDNPPDPGGAQSSLWQTGTDGIRTTTRGEEVYMNCRHKVLHPTQDSIPNEISKTFWDSADIPFFKGNDGVASAAYSLRDLTGDDVSVVRVRRSSDNAEKDFTASEVADGTLEDWVTANQSGRINFASGSNDWTSYGRRDDAPADAIFKCNTYGTQSLRQAYDHTSDPDGIGASPTSDSDYSFKFDSRKSEGYNRVHGLKVETIEDNEIPFSVTFKYFIPEGQPNITADYTSTISGNLTTTGEWTEVTVRNTSNISDGLLLRSQAVTTTGGLFYIADVRISADTSHGHVETWYDQSDNGYDARELTAKYQPKIVENGSLVTDTDGKIAIKGTGSKLRLGHFSWLGESPREMLSSDGTHSLFIVCDLPDQTAGNANYNFISRFYSTSLSPKNRRPQVYLRKTNGSLSGAAEANSSKVTVNSSDAQSAQLITDIVNPSGTTKAEKHSVYVDGTFNAEQPFGTSWTPDGNTTLHQTAVLFSRGETTVDTYISEVIYYPSDQSYNRLAIETNIINHYNI